ncbi:MAG: ATP-binding cassette domain-containing protein [Xanthobacteraceae bacterium]|nr:ATP-binding cassette domain-containing protein [Xanthobacteraceae bacterium]MBX3522207.1 ATP-binding cassette domain-containing protein [Xanthobacteraceae bacterium]MBX3535412.1 ATP-binding cassette domain-containing protein [Xanthobacteraceae bacterium]MBX3548890.1 ATP-binding cassette domain-containing protein [Xanthobacteraceae bacterium]MCW5674521.1 ATP-binding cassette domain-containing protein [Xanthobacteraceae bacterium]
MSVVLEARNLNKSFGSVVAANDINVTVNRAERLGLIGTNGAGKTTFVNIVTGYIKPDSGAITLEGRDITACEPRVITKEGVCRSFQVPQLFLTLTTAQNLAVAIGIAQGQAFSPYATIDDAMAEAIDALLERFRLGDYRDQTVSELPGGVRKLIDIAVAVTRKPKVLLLDEPTSGVAAEQKFALMDIIMSALDSDVTVLFVEHDMDIVSRYAQRVLAFYDGRIIADDLPQAVLENQTVKMHITGTAG